MGRVVLVRIQRGREFVNIGLDQATDAELEQVARRHDALEGWRWARRIAGELRAKAAPPAEPEAIGAARPPVGGGPW
jgi:hypothetical protein